MNMAEVNMEVNIMMEVNMAVNIVEPIKSKGKGRKVRRGRETWLATG
jgi:hypothetical protein